MPQIPMYEEKRCGSYRVLNYWKNEKGMEVLIKKVKLTQGNYTSYHQYLKRQEIVTIMMGRAEILIEVRLYKLQADDVLQIPAGTKHGIKAVTYHELMEVLLGNEFVLE